MKESTINVTFRNVAMTIEVLSAKEIACKDNLTEGEQRLRAHELSGIEPVDDVLLIHGDQVSSGHLKEMLRHLGFNIDVLLGKKHLADFDGVSNIGGYRIPGWHRFVTMLPSRWRKTLLLPYAPGIERLHLRAFKLEENRWVVVAHTDLNWMTLNPVSLYKAHVGSGAGDYVRGTALLHRLLESI